MINNGSKAWPSRPVIQILSCWYAEEYVRQFYLEDGVQLRGEHHVSTGL